MKKTFTSNIPFNKTNFFKLEQERNMLKITLQYINAENTKLKNELEDMRITARKNKEMLKGTSLLYSGGGEHGLYP